MSTDIIKTILSNLVEMNKINSALIEQLQRVSEPSPPSVNTVESLLTELTPKFPELFTTTNDKKRKRDDDDIIEKVVKRKKGVSVYNCQCYGCDYETVEEGAGKHLEERLGEHNKICPKIYDEPEERQEDDYSVQPRSEVMTSFLLQRIGWTKSLCIELLDGEKGEKKKSKEWLCQCFCCDAEFLWRKTDTTLDRHVCPKTYIKPQNTHDEYEEDFPGMKSEAM